MINNYNYQAEANISCLLEDVEYSERKECFLMLFEEFFKEGIGWGVACSMNLFLRGIVDDFHDLDLIVDIKDIDKIKKIMKRNGAKLIATGGNGYCESAVYLHYQLGRTDIDVISGFQIVTFGTNYIYNFNSKELDYVKIDEIKVPLISIEALYILYYMMEGWQKKRRYKRILIEEFILVTKIKHPTVFKKALSSKLPNWIKTSIKSMLELK